jgi:hypothetical protein
MFGDALSATVETVVDPALVDPRSVRVHADFRPYRASSTRVVRRQEGRLTSIEFRYRLECLVRKCLPNGAERHVVFRPVRITYGAGETQTAFWPPVQLASRVAPQELQDPVLRSELVRQPAVTYGVRPQLAVAALLAVAVLLLAYPALLAFRLARHGWRTLRTSRFERLTPMERALELMRRAAAAGEGEPSRRALERVARELGEHELVTDARRMAWSRPRPESDEMDSLRARLEDGA